MDCQTVRTRRSSRRYFPIERAARCPSATASMMSLGPKATSPPAYTPAAVVARLSRSTRIKPRAVTSIPSSSRIQERSDAWPIA